MDSCGRPNVVHRRELVWYGARNAAGVEYNSNAQCPTCCRTDVANVFWNTREQTGLEMNREMRDKKKKVVKTFDQQRMQRVRVEVAEAVGRLWTRRSTENVRSTLRNPQPPNRTRTGSRLKFCRRLRSITAASSLPLKTRRMNLDSRVLRG